MKKILFILPLLFLSNCKDDDTINNCNFLIDVGVNATINLNLPEFNNLLFTSGVVLISNQGGNAGFYIINIGNDQYRAWDAADPNHAQQNCSFMQRDGIEVTCSCVDENKYNLFTGQALGSQLPCGLKEYRVNVSGNTIVISN
nr:hypothetical protein [uncultured Psychroserpens sp.]